MREGRKENRGWKKVGGGGGDKGRREEKERGRKGRGKGGIKEESRKKIK